MKTYLRVDVPVWVIGCYSEAMMHDRYAGRLIRVVLRQWQDSTGQVYHSGAVVKDDGTIITGFTTGEVGIRQDEEGFYADVIDPKNTSPDENPEQIAEEMREMLISALSSR